MLLPTIIIYGKPDALNDPAITFLRYGNSVFHNGTTSKVCLIMAKITIFDKTAIIFEVEFFTILYNIAETKRCTHF